MLDEAMLRPGRLEVQIEIGLPDEAGRLQILKIHTNKVTHSPIPQRGTREHAPRRLAACTCMRGR